MKHWLKKVWQRRQRRLHGLRIAQRVSFRLRINIPQYDDDVKWMNTEFDAWIEEFPQYRKK